MHVQLRVTCISIMSIDTATLKSTELSVCDLELTLDSGLTIKAVAALQPGKSGQMPWLNKIFGRPLRQSLSRM